MAKTTNAPSWWKNDYDSAWDRVKEAFRRDWEQTKHDWGGNAPDLKQDVNDTVGQAVGTKPVPPPTQPNYEDDEPAYRFGYGARRHYGENYRDWDDRLESQLRRDWETTYPNDNWDRRRSAIRRGWDFTEPGARL